MKKTSTLLILALLSLGNQSLAMTGIPYTAYYGLTHSHTASNGDDGRGTLDEAFQYARKQGKLDFFACTPHCRALTPKDYQNLRETAQKYHQEGSFVTFVGQEWGSLTNGGHANIFEADRLCQVNPGDWKTLYQEWLPKHQEIGWTSLNHPRKSDFAPHLKSDAAKLATIATICSHSNYGKEDEKAPLFSLDETYDYFLNQGFKVGAGGDQDNHQTNWGTSSQVRTGVWANKLSKTEITRAIQARRIFATHIADLKLWFTLNGQEMGSEVSSEPTMQFTVILKDPTQTTTQLYLYGDTDGVGGETAAPIGQIPVQNGQASWTFDYQAPQAGPMYFYVRAGSKDGITAFSSPIWVNVAK